MNKIAVIEKDETYQELIKTVLAEYEVQVLAKPAVDLLQAVREINPEVIIVDLDSLENDPLVVCQRLLVDDNLKDTPVLALTNELSADQQVALFRSGIHDYLPKPFDVLRFIGKVQSLIQVRVNMEARRHSVSLLNQMQSELVQNQLVHQFRNSAIFFKDINELADQFTAVANVLGIGFVAKITGGEFQQLFSDSGAINAMERNILGYDDKLDRITNFGNNRILFKWPHTTLLLRSTNKLVNTDSISLLLDGIEDGIKTILTEMAIEKKLALLSEENQKLKESLDELFLNMLIDIKHIMVEFGYGQSLTEDEEERLVEVLNRHNENFVIQLDSLKDNSDKMFGLVEELRSPPVAIREKAGMGPDQVELF
jgi:two-component system cell cycle response regulator DivK